MKKALGCKLQAIKIINQLNKSQIVILPLLFI